MKHNYTKSYFNKYGSQGKSYQISKNNPTFKKSLCEIKQLGFNGRILDIGCAEGFFLKECKDYGFETFGVDISSYIIGKAKNYLKDTSLFTLDMSTDKLPFNNNFVNVVTMLDSLEHIENPQHALREVRRVLKNRGLLHIRLPSLKRGLLEPTHVNFYSKTSVEVLLKKHGFKIIKLGNEGGLLQIPAGLIRLLLRRNTYFNFVPFGGKFISCYAIKI